MGEEPAGVQGPRSPAHFIEVPKASYLSFPSSLENAEEMKVLWS